MSKIERKKGFTLIELMLVMVLLAILALLLVGNFNSTLKRGRDSARKSDLSQLQKTLELYYEDNKTYPPFTDIFNKKLCTADNCITGTTYMIKTPKDPSSVYKYVYAPQNGGSSYYLYSYIENDLDQGSGVSMSGYTTSVMCDVANTTPCRYYVSSSNAEPLTPNP